MVITIVDYGMGNLGSIINMLKRIGAEGQISADGDEIRKAEKIVLPGIGAFDAGMRKLHELGLVEILNELVLKQKIPTLGVCLGMQLLTRSSEEGSLEGLGWIDARTIRFTIDSADTELKVPHMGWNNISVLKRYPLFGNLDQGARFYFVHSYHVVCSQEEDIAATANYGVEFVAAVQKQNIFGVQFHPEKSHKYGMSVLRAFAESA